MQLSWSLILSLLLHLFLLLAPLSMFPTKNAAGPMAMNGSYKSERFLLATFQPAIDSTSRSTNEDPRGEWQASLSENRNNIRTSLEESPTKQEYKEQVKPPIESSHSGNNEPHYYSRSEVDHPARMIDSLIAKNGPLEQALRDYDERGNVTFELWINETGGIDKAVSVKNGISEAAFGAIRSVVARTSFIPARLNNQAVRSKMMIEIEVLEKTTKASQ